MNRPLIAAIDGHQPRIDATAFIAPATVLLGRVSVGANSSIWYGSILRGDDDDIVIGSDCNVQDGCILHADPGFPTVLGDRVSLGHAAIVHGAHVESDVLIGMRAVVLNGARIGSYSLVAAGAVVRPGMDIPANSFVVGVPAKVLRPLEDKEREMIEATYASYRKKAERHRTLWT